MVGSIEIGREVVNRVRLEEKLALEDGKLTESWQEDRKSLEILAGWLR